MDMKSNPWFILSIFFTCFYPTFHTCHGVATITRGQSVSGRQTIVSPGNIFELGFFRPGNASNYYIGIWYKTVSPQTTVWVANRGQPVSDKYSSELTILHGNLVLLNESGIPIWSTNLSSTNTSSSTEAALLDTGNLVLRDRSNSSEPLWQSFDHPTDSWLPGMKLGFNKLNKKRTRLISWKSEEDPAPGLFSLAVDPHGTGQFIIIWNGSRQYWTSGQWNGQIFSLVPEMRLNYIYNFSKISNDNELYFTYSMYDSSIISRYVMHVGGQIQQQSWLERSRQWNLFWSQPQVACESYAYCGAFGICNMKELPFCNCLEGFRPKSPDECELKVYSRGCTRRNSLQCGKSENKFVASYNMILPANEKPTAAGSAQECQASCSNDCSCTAYAYDNNLCSLWFGDLFDLRQLADEDPSGRTLYVKLAANLDHFSSSNNTKSRAICSVIGCVVIVLVICLFLFQILRRRKRRIKMDKLIYNSLVAFGYHELQNATKNFSNKLGEGGFGSVFKGMLPDSSVIAVKKLESINQGEKQFRAEVSIIGKIQHINLVRLRGFCTEGTRKLLVYDYMANGSLDSHIFHGKCSKVLDWKTRYKIALGIARGLAYLHENCTDYIIHSDIKPDNILLDDEFCPKVADFGLAKLFGHDFSRVLTTIRGTVGYLAPEWILGMAVTTKADVYSYGMMLFEFVSSRRNTEQSKYGKMEYFPIHVAKLVNENGNVLSLLDPRLEGNADVDELLRVCKIACWCIQDDQTQRPSMGQVVYILEGVLDVNVPPIPRFLQELANDEDYAIFLTESA